MYDILIDYSVSLTLLTFKIFLDLYYHNGINFSI